MNSDKNGHVLYYTRPAAGPREALPMGNGRIRCLNDGGPELWRFSLSHNLFWSGYREAYVPEEKNLPDFLKQEEEKRRQAGRRLARDKDTAPAFETYLSEHFLNSAPQLKLKLGELSILCEQPEESELSLYERSLDFSEAIHQTDYIFAGGRDVIEYPFREYKRESFVSAAEDLLLLKCESVDSAPMHAEINFFSAFRSELVETFSGEGWASYIFTVYAPEKSPLLRPGRRGGKGTAAYEDQNGRRVYVGLKIKASGGQLNISEGDRGIILDQATAYEVYFSYEVEKAGRDADAALRNRLVEISGKSYEAYKKEHLEAYRKFYEGGFDLRFEPAVTALQVEKKYDTAVRLNRFRHAAVFNDSGLITLLLRYSRYLAYLDFAGAEYFPANQPFQAAGIPEEAEGFCHLERDFSLPYGMLGIWGLAERAQGLFGQLPIFMEKGREQALELYGLEGMVLHAFSDSEGFAGAASFPKASGLRALWPLGAVSIADALSELADYYPEKEGDEAKLQLLAFCQESVRFLLSYMKETDEGLLMAPLPLSDGDDEAPGLFERTAEAQSLLASHLALYLRLGEAFMRRSIFPDFFDADLYQQAMDIRSDIAETPLLEEGAPGLRGSFKPYASKTPHQKQYRSALRALLLNPNDAPHLASRPLRRTLNALPEYEDDSNLRRACLRAAAGEGDRAFDLLMRALSRPCTKNSPFGMSDNLIFAEGAEDPEGNTALALAFTMLFIREGKDGIELMPALPLALTSGEIENFSCKCGARLSFTFAERMLQNVWVSNPRPLPVKLNLRYRRKILALSLEGGESLNLSREDFA